MLLQEVYVPTAADALVAVAVSVVGEVVAVAVSVVGEVVVGPIATGGRDAVAVVIGRAVDVGDFDVVFVGRVDHGEVGKKGSQEGHRALAADVANVGSTRRLVQGSKVVYLCLLTPDLGLTGVK